MFTISFNVLSHLCLVALCQKRLSIFSYDKIENFGRHLGFVFTIVRVNSLYYVVFELPHLL